MLELLAHKRRAVVARLTVVGVGDTTGENASSLVVTAEGERGSGTTQLKDISWANAHTTAAENVKVVVRCIEMYCLTLSGRVIKISDEN